MREFLFQYHGVSPTTWAYLSSLLMIGLFFKFGRFWSVRNVDVMLLILLAPGLLLIHFGNGMQGKMAWVAAEATKSSPSNQSSPPNHSATTVAQNANAVESDGDRVSDRDAAVVSPEFERGQRLECTGYFWLLSVGLIWLARLLLDPAMIRRPLLTPNLSVGGLTFIGVFLFVFLMANVITMQPAPNAATGPGNPGADTSITRMDTMLAYQHQRGPGYAVLNILPVNGQKTLAVISHLAVVIGLVLVGYRHFDNTTNGIGAAMMYLMLPYTSQLTGRVDHVLPAAILIWAVLCYRRPIVAGLLVGAAAGCVYYPLFVLPLWISFYWSRGMIRFLMGTVVSLLILCCGLVIPSGSEGLLPGLTRMFGIIALPKQGLEGIWNESIGGWDPVFRLSMLAGFLAVAFGLAIWPARKNLGTLISCTAAVMLATQFWHGYGGGLYMAWYLPLILLTIFRPNLEDRVAQTVIVDGWFAKRSAPAASKSLAA